MTYTGRLKALTGMRAGLIQYGANRGDFRRSSTRQSRTRAVAIIRETAIVASRVCHAPTVGSRRRPEAPPCPFFVTVTERLKGVLASAFVFRKREPIMKIRNLSRPSTALCGAIAAVTCTSLTVAPVSQAEAQAQQTASSPQPRTPIEHVIMIIGENRTFDHVFATYTPRAGETVNNLLSQGIVKADGTPGPNFAKAAQNSASDTSTYMLNPPGQLPISVLPPAMTDGAPSSASDESPPPFATLAAATAAFNQINDGLPADAYNL